MEDLRIGISGWTYPPWRGTFYPEKWPQKRELEYASRKLNSIEINGSFYSLQLPSSYQAWHDATPDDFVFSVKAGRFITHLKRLKDVEAPVANFFASGLLCLRAKLGPVLWQLPPNLLYDHDRLASFFALLPRDTSEAAKLAKHHDSRLEGRAYTRTDCNRPLKHALEVRHSTFKTAEFVQLLRKHDIALVIADTAGKWPFMEDVTSDLVYIRLHGDEVLYVSGYTEDALNEWARKIRQWIAGKNPTKTELIAPPAKPSSSRRAVHVYFDNDVKVRAPFDAMTLAHKLGISPPPPTAPPIESIAEEPRIGWAAPVDPRWQFNRPRKTVRR